MRWVDDIEPAYTRYATTYALDYDSFEPVQSNPNLAPILAQLDWPASLPPSSQTGVSLDRLFELPLYRVQYYQRLYAKLLRSTQEGRSDHALLVSANEKLAHLESLCEQGKQRSVLPSPPPAVSETAESTVTENSTSNTRAEEDTKEEEEEVHFGGDRDLPEPLPPKDDASAPPPPPAQKPERASPPRLHVDVSQQQPPGRHAASDSDSSLARTGESTTAPQRTSNDSATFDSPLTW